MKDKNIIFPEEEEIEKKWKKEKGINPETGKMWLTPRMIRDIKKLESKWKNQGEMDP